MKKTSLELLAPAGNKIKMKTAFFYGADAVYLGIPEFSLRVRINDFNLDEVKEALKYAHDLKKRVYITVNIFAHNRHLELLPKYLKELNKIKPDAFIVSDPGIILLLKKYCPKIPLHLSTQANCTNSVAVKFWQKQGISRIILGREVTLREIAEIHRACPKMELEYFVHGAMCMAYSGRCFLSKEYLDRSANLGDCVQPCRWEYETFIKAKGHDEVFELVTEDHGSYLLNSKDLCLLKYLKELIKAGVTSFKIEGRAKSVYYLANLVGIYKEALKNPKKINRLYDDLENKLVHRGYTTGFLLEKKGEQNINDTHNKINWEFCGQVVKSEWLKKGIYQIWVKVHNSLKLGDEIEIILPPYNILSLQVDKIINDEDGSEIKEAHGGGGGQIVILEVASPQVINELVVLRRKIV